MQPTQWHTSSTAEPSTASEASDGSRRAGSSRGASTSGRQPVDYVFSFLSSHRQQEIATVREATGERAASLNIYDHQGSPEPQSWWELHRGQTCHARFSMEEL